MPLRYRQITCDSLNMAVSNSAYVRVRAMSSPNACSARRSCTLVRMASPPMSSAGTTISANPRRSLRRTVMLDPALECLAPEAEHAGPSHRDEEQNPARLARGEEHAQAPRRRIDEGRHHPPNDARHRRQCEPDDHRGDDEEGERRLRQDARPRAALAEFARASDRARGEDDAPDPLERGK